MAIATQELLQTKQMNVIADKVTIPGRDTAMHG
jgi:hypothetical protein